MALNALRTDQLPEAARIGGQINIASTGGVITDALVAANPTITGLNAALLSPTFMQSTIRTQLRLALTRGTNLTLWPETHGVTTVAGLLGLTGKTSVMKQGFLG